MDVIAHPVHLMVRLDGEPVKVVEARDTVVAGIYNVVEYVPAASLQGAVEALQRIVDLPCPLGRDGDPLGQAQRIASEAITAAGGR